MAGSGGFVNGEAYVKQTLHGFGVVVVHVQRAFQRLRKCSTDASN
jgi:hypothetical protein